MAKLKSEQIIIADDPKDFTHVEVNPQDLTALSQFFKDYEGLTTGELAILCKRSSETIREWKHRLKLGLRTNPFKRNYASAKRTEVERVTDPLVWDNRDWFYNQYVVIGRGKALIGRVIKKTPAYVQDRLKYYKIERRKFEDAVRSTNPCCCEAWLYFNYATHKEYAEWCLENRLTPNPLGGRGLGLVECAKMAGVVPYTIVNWLTKFRLHIRDAWESQLNRKNAKHLLDKAQSEHPAASPHIKSA